MSSKVNTLQEVRTQFKHWLMSCGYSVVQANIISNNAYYLDRVNLNVSLSDVVLGKVDIIACQNILKKHFAISGDEEASNKKVQEYLAAISMLRRYLSENDVVIEDNSFNMEKSEHFFQKYCENMRMQYSYKPLLIIALIECANKKGGSNLTALAYYFISYYAHRMASGLVPEKEDSVFAKCDVTLEEAESNILNNALKKLMKDCIVQMPSKNEVYFTPPVWDEIRQKKDTIVHICNNVLDAYFAKIASTEDLKAKKLEIQLGLVLNDMYLSAPTNEMVTMIHLFGVRYADLIRANNLSVRNILSSSGLQASYLTELNKGIKLAKYVKEKE